MGHPLSLKRRRQQGGHTDRFPPLHHVRLSPSASAACPTQRSEQPLLQPDPLLEATALRPFVRS